MRLDYSISWSKKVSDEEYLRFDYFIRNSCGKSSEKGLTGYRFNTCLINYNSKGDQLNIEIMSPITTSPRETLEEILKAMKNGKSLLSKT